jgi:type II secretory pathway pseudopilin PulG
MMEVLVALALLGLLLALVLPRITTRPLDLLADARAFAAETKAARARAIGRTTRYRIVVNAPTSYEVARADGAVWTTERTVALRPQVQFDGSGPTCAEFDSRGRLVSTPACPVAGVQLTFTLRDVGRNLTHRVIIHGAGLVEDRP